MNRYPIEQVEHQEHSPIQPEEYQQTLQDYPYDGSLIVVSTGA